MVTDPISDLLVRLRNGFRRNHDVVTIPASKLKHEVLRVLHTEGYIQGIEAGTEDGHPVLKVQLRYVGEGQPMITGMQRVLGHIKDTGSIDGMQNDVAGFNERQRLVNKPLYDALEQKYTLG